MVRLPPGERAQILLAPYFASGTHSDSGQEYRVLDARRLFANKGLVEKYFSAAQRTEPVYVWHPKEGEPIHESGRPETVASGGETVFIKKLGANALKIYIPSDSSGPLDQSILDSKYSPNQSSTDPAIADVLPAGVNFTIRTPKELPIPILHQVIGRPTVILDARGLGKHQFMEPGDSLKFEDGECLPLSRKELDTAWKVTQRGHAR